METKKNRLKRKPKVSPVAQQGSNSTATKPEHRDSTCDTAVDVIIIDEESDATAIAADVNRSATPAAISQVPEVKDKALHDLVKMLFEMDRLRKQQPLESLPTLPAFEEPAVVKGNDTTDSQPCAPGGELPPLPKICPCHLQRRKKNRHTLGVSKVAEGLVNSTLQDEQVLSVEPDENISSREHNQQIPHSSAISNADIGSDLATVRALNASVSKKEATPEITCVDVKSQRASLKSKTEFEGCSSNSRRPVSSFRLFSTFSSPSCVSDDLNEFEDSSRLTSSVTSVRQKTLAKQSLASLKRSAENSLTKVSAGKRRKTDSSTIGRKNIPMTKALFPLRTKPIFSSAKTSSAGRLQTQISSVSTSSSSQDASNVSNDGSSGSGCHGKPSVSTSADTHCEQRALEVAHASGGARPKKNESGGGRSDPADEEGGRVRCCPLCQVVFSTALSQLDIDGHIAACLSANDEDIVW